MSVRGRRASEPGRCSKPDPTTARATLPFLPVTPRAVLCPAEQLAWKGVGPGPPPSSACPSAVTAEGPPSSETSLRCLDPSCPHSWGFPAGCSEAPHQAHACPKDVETGGSQPASQLTVLVPQAGYPSSCGVACPLPHRWRGARVVWGSASSGECGLSQPPRLLTGRLQVLTTWGSLPAAPAPACPSIQPGPGRDGPEVIRHRCSCSRTPE